MKYIGSNIVPDAAMQIGVYDNTGKRIGSIPLDKMKQRYEGLPNHTSSNTKRYSFGLLSDVHNETDQADENSDDLLNALRIFNEDPDIKFTAICGDLT